MSMYCSTFELACSTFELESLSKSEYFAALEFERRLSVSAVLLLAFSPTSHRSYEDGGSKA
jgi:hypothetical protein